KITNGALTGKIWINNGEVIDAVTSELAGEPAFHKILSWRSGNFESLPAETEHRRTIYNSYQGLLLETAQAQDEAQGQSNAAANAKATATPSGETASPTPLTPLCRFEGVEFVLALKPGTEKAFESLGLENPE